MFVCFQSYHHSLTPSANEEVSSPNNRRIKTKMKGAPPHCCSVAHHVHSKPLYKPETGRCSQVLFFNYRDSNTYHLFPSDALDACKDVLISPPHTKPSLLPPWWLHQFFAQLQEWGPIAQAINRKQSLNPAFASSRRLNNVWHCLTECWPILFSSPDVLWWDDMALIHSLCEWACVMHCDTPISINTLVWRSMI